MVSTVMGSGTKQLFSGECPLDTFHGHFLTRYHHGHFQALLFHHLAQMRELQRSLSQSECRTLSKLRNLLSVFLGKRSMTGNDFRGDGWQETRMRKLEHSGCGGYQSRSWPRPRQLPHSPRKQRPGRTCNHLTVGFSSLKITWG